ncbi:MAG: tRNA (adenosine(37)-N6)-threonylcarbamoyltransferase complex dimerization subunit type 1 TsaB [Acidimicrobiales bacterium]
MGVVNILAIETATPACAVGIRTADGVEVTRVVDDGRRHTEALTGAMKVLMEEVGLTPRDVDRVVVDRGPGLFTGLRVGIATAIGFSQALGCELVAVTSLEMLAGGAFEGGVRGTLVACVDGRRGEVFAQTFLLDEGVLALDDPRVTTAEEITANWAEKGPATFTGDGVERYRGEFEHRSFTTIFDQTVPSVHAGLSLGASRNPDEVVTPLYLREADAVANFTTRERPR